MSKKHSLRSLVFDLDGTLIDTVPGVALAVRESCAAVGLQAAADYNYEAWAAGCSAALESVSAGRSAC